MSDEIEIYRCKECGKISTSLGWLHGHAGKHRGWGISWLRIVPPWKVGDAEALMEMTETLQITDYEVVEDAS
ncbi:hypothetical protein OB905_13125 [Halobacteria archaeon AArc-dxtr1]|nr:hypothetical protein [Halobacteria archaeon AArc-dxtr1]